MKVLIVYYSLYGHVHRLAEAVAEGVREVDGAEVALRRVPETLSADVLAAARFQGKYVAQLAAKLAR